MYTVHMKRYSVAQARQRFAELLDTAEQGQSVMIERRGVRFLIEARRQGRRRSARRKPVIEHVDPAITAGAWTWSWKNDGVRFQRRRRAG